MSPKSPNLYKKTQIIFDGLSPDEIKKSLKYLYELKKETLLATFHSVLPEERTKNFQDTREFVKNALNNFKSHDSKDLIEHYSLKGPLIPINQSKCTFKAISLDKTQYCIRKIKLKKAQTYQQILSYVKKYWYSVKLDPYYFRVIDNIFVSKLHRNRMIIVSKFIPGENLEIALKTYREFQDINFCLGIFKEIAKIVDSLHIRYGICHGDLRPQNIIYNRKTKRITIIGFKFQFSLYDSYNSPFALGVMRRKCPGYVRKHNETFFKYVSDYRQIGCAEDMFALGHILFNLISSGDMLWTTCHKRDKNFYYYKCYSDGLLRYDEKLLKLLSSRTYPIDQTLSYIRALPTLKKMIKLRDSNRLDFFTLLSSPWFNELQDGQQTSEISTTDNITPKNTAVSDDSMEIPVEIQAKIDKLSPKQLKHLVKQYRKKEHQTTFESFYSILPPQDHSNLTLSELVNYAENSIKTKEYLKHRNLVQCYGLPSFKRSGKGGFGSIYKSTSPDKKKTYAIKLVPMAPLADVTSEQIMNEYFISSKLDPRYFSVGIDILASTIDERFFIIVQNFISGIDLSKAISTCKRFRDINFTLGIFKQITIALYYLNIGYDICHADLSLRNIMYNRKTKRIKIIDFGMSLNMKTTPNHENLKRLLTRGSPGYVIRNSYTNFEDQKDYIDIGSSKDIFSLGHILFNLISAGELLWLDCEKDIRFNKYRKCSDNLISYWDRAQKLVCSKTYPIKKVMIYLRVLPTLKKMIDLDDTMRIDFITLVDSLWFKELPIYLTPKPTPVETVQSRPYSIKQSIKDALDILSMVASVGFVLYAVGYIF